MKHVKIAPCISLYEDVMSESSVIEFLAKVEEEAIDEWSDLEWDYGKTGTGSTTDTRTSINCLLTSLLPPYETTELSDFYKKNIFLPCLAVAQDYRQEFMLEDCIPEEFAILKYYQGGYYRAHYDHWRDNKRVFSIVASLGEAESGGELEFPTFDVTVKLKTGSVLMFPSNFPYLHVAHPVLEGVKHSLVSWFC